ncbi:MAG: winged helix-turn-helix transcriptional regulator [Planctomycetes bacterium]|nr:winged helix-turn-helix transcriptional regulator [Planctomycetota bacterium]
MIHEVQGANVNTRTALRMSTPARPSPDPASSIQGWTFLSNHAHVLICLAREPDLVLREVAARVGITERAVQKIVVDLEHEGLLTRSRDGRRNRYVLHLDRPLRHPLEAHRSVRELIELVTRGG